MTCREKLAIEHPKYIDKDKLGGCDGCPSHYGYLKDPENCPQKGAKYRNGKIDWNNAYIICNECWNREIPNSEPEPNSQLDIHALIDEAMQKRDRSVAIYIHPENGMSVNVYPWPDVGDLRELYEDGRITANEFRAKMNLPMIKNAEKFMKRSREE